MYVLCCKLFLRALTGVGTYKTFPGNSYNLATSLIYTIVYKYDVILLYIHCTYVLDNAIKGETS